MREDDWISVDERLPENDVCVLVRDSFLPGLDEVSLSTARLWNGYWIDYRGDKHVYAKSVTHWQPLPPPPKQKDPNQPDLFEETK